MVRRGRTALLLEALAWVRPYHWARFYERTRIYRPGLTTDVPQVMLNITRECPLDCAFCFASSAPGTGLRLSLEQIEALGSELDGVHKLMVIGGEPLSHPQIGPIMGMLSEWTEQIEIFTNGICLPEKLKAAVEYIKTTLFTDETRLTLTLAVDSYHEEQIGAERLRNLIDIFLALPEEIALTTRFNVTSRELSTWGYIPIETVQSVLNRFHPGLVSLLEEGAVDQPSARLYLNPVVRMGSAQEMGGGGMENLRASDVLNAPEIAISLDGEGRAKVYNYLPATWMPRAPAATELGNLDFQPLHELVRDKIVATVLEFDDDPAGAAVFELLHARCGHDGAAVQAAKMTARALLAKEMQSDASSRALQAHLERDDYERCARIMEVRALLRLMSRWPVEQVRYYQKVSDRLIQLMEGGPGQSYDLFSYEEVRSIPLPAQTRFLSDYLSRNPEFEAILFKDLVESISALAENGEVWRYSGLTPRPGLIQARAESSALSRTRLNTGLRLAWAYYSEQGLIEPQITISRGGSVSIELDGITKVSGRADEREAAILEYLVIIAALLGKDFAFRLSDTLGYPGGNHGRMGARLPSEPELDPLLDVFEHLAQGKSDSLWNNGEALVCLLDESWKKWPRADCENWLRLLRGHLHSFVLRSGQDGLSHHALKILQHSGGKSR